MKKHPRAVLEATNRRPIVEATSTSPRRHLERHLDVTSTSPRRHLDVRKYVGMVPERREPNPFTLPNIRGSCLAVFPCCVVFLCFPSLSFPALWGLARRKRRSTGAGAKGHPHHDARLVRVPAFLGGTPAPSHKNPTKQKKKLGSREGARPGRKRAPPLFGHTSSTSVTRCRLEFLDATCGLGCLSMLEHRWVHRIAESVRPHCVSFLFFKKDARTHPSLAKFRLRRLPAFRNTRLPTAAGTHTSRGKKQRQSSRPGYIVCDRLTEVEPGADTRNTGETTPLRILPRATGSTTPARWHDASGGFTPDPEGRRRGFQKRGALRGGRVDLRGDQARDHVRKEVRRIHRVL